MVFLVQATQNRDSAAIHLKLDEIVRSLDRASNELLDMEELTPEDLNEIRQDYEKLARKAKSAAHAPGRVEAVPKKPGKGRKNDHG